MVKAQHGTGKRVGVSSPAMMSPAPCCFLQTASELFYNRKGSLPTIAPFFLGEDLLPQVFSLVN
jgi:hypothetical protein